MNLYGNQLEQYDLVAKVVAVTDGPGQQLKLLIQKQGNARVCFRQVKYVAERMGSVLGFNPTEIWGQNSNVTWDEAAAIAKAEMDPVANTAVEIRLKAEHDIKELQSIATQDFSVNEMIGQLGLIAIRCQQLITLQEAFEHPIPASAACAIQDAMQKTEDLEDAAPHAESMSRVSQWRKRQKDRREREQAKESRALHRKEEAICHRPQQAEGQQQEKEEARKQAKAAASAAYYEEEMEAIRQIADKLQKIRDKEKTARRKAVARDTEDKVDPVIAELIGKMWAAGKSRRAQEVAVKLKRRIEKCRAEKAMRYSAAKRKKKAEQHGWGFKWQSTLQLLQIRAALKEARREQQKKEVVAAVNFRSVLVQIDVRHEGTWKKALAIADSGSGKTIFQLADWAEIAATEGESLGEANHGLVTADGSPLEGLAGAGTVRFRFTGSEKVHQVESELTQHTTTRILGTNFWEQNKAIFDFASQQICIRNEAEHEIIPFWTRDGRLAEECKKKAAACEEEAEALQQKRKQEEPQQMSARVRAAKMQVWDQQINQKLSDCEHYSRVASIAAGEKVSKAQVHLAEDVLVPARRNGIPGKIEKAVRGIIPVRHEQMSAAQLLAVESASFRVIKTVDDGKEDMKDGETEMVEIDPVPLMLVRPDLQEGSPQVQVQIAMCNDSDEDLFIKKGTVVASVREAGPEDIAEVVEEDSDYESEDEGRVDERIKGMTGREVVEWVSQGNVVNGTTFEAWLEEHGKEIKFGPRTTEDLKDAISKLLYVFQRAVAADPRKPGKMKGVEFGVELKDPNVTPIKCRYRRYSPMEKEAIREECQAMLDKGVVEFSDSPWSAPVVLVKKKDGKWRFCVNFTATINPHIKQDSEPLWKQQDVLEELGTADTMSLWDVASGYWSCVVRKEDRKYLAFGTDSHGLLQFTRMPFGCSTSGSFFSRQLTRILRSDGQGEDGPYNAADSEAVPPLRKVVCSFVDDGAVHTTKQQSHVDALARVLSQLAENNVTIKMEKCTWGTDEGKLLGHQVRLGDGLRADIDKVEAMATLELTDKQTLKSFLGSAVYLSKFVKDYAELTEPLYILETLLQYPDSPIPNELWTEQCRRSHKFIVAALSSYPVLSFPDWSLPFVIVSDCNAKQAGGVLMQIDKDGNERIIAYFSKRLTKAQKKWGITSREGYAAILCTRRWRAYIHGQPCVLVTDHKALTSLRSGKEFNSGRMNRFAAELMEYDLAIAYRPGRFCHIPDLLSRGNIPEEPEVRERLTRESLEWKATQDLKEADRQALKTAEEDNVGEDPWCSDAMPSYQSRAKLALEGDDGAYDEGRVQEHLKLLLRGAVVEGERGDTCETLMEKVESLTEAMRRGEHQPQYGEGDDIADEDPLIVQVYDAVCTIVGWKPPECILPRQAEIRQVQGDSEKWRMRREAVEKGTSSNEEVEEWRRRNEQDFVVQEGILMRSWVKGNGKYAQVVWQVVIPEALEDKVIEGAHSSSRGAHYGTLRTFAAIRDKYYIEQLYSKVEAKVARCETCGRHGNKPAQVKRTHQITSDIPGEFWIIDLLHFPKSEEGLEYCVTMIDVCSRWGIAQPLRVKKAGAITAREVALCVLEQWSKLGCHINPRRVTHDGGPELKGIFEDVCAILLEERHVSVARRAFGHGAVERYNRDISQLVAKMCPDKLVDDKWPWVLPSAVEAHNSALHAPNAIGSISVSPTELMYGVPPVLSVMEDKEAEFLFKNMKPGSVEHVRRIAEARKLAIAHVRQSRQKYVKQLIENNRNLTRSERAFIQGQIVRLTEKRDPTRRKENKLKSTNTAKYVVVSAEGYGRYVMQLLGDGNTPLEERHVDDLQLAPSTPEEATAAEEQAEEAAQGLIEWTVEEILEERGSKAKGTKQYLVKYEGEDKPSWQPAEDIDDNLEALLEFKAKKGVKAIQEREGSVTANLAEYFHNPKGAIRRIWEDIGVQADEVLLTHAAVPCRSFSIASHSGHGRVIKDSPGGHGCNFRQTDQFRSPCCDHPDCKYGKIARAHDLLAQGVKLAFEDEKKRNGEFQWGIENPAYGDLPRRDYMQPKEWKTEYKKIPAIDMCAYNHKYQAPKVYYTSLMDYTPVGRTGNGRCNNGQCGQGEFNGRHFSHYGKLARQPADGPRGPGALREKNSYPVEWCIEILKAAMAKNPNAKVVVDLFSGWQSFRKACEALGLTYIGVDIMGDRNRFVREQQVAACSTVQQCRRPWVT